MRRRAFLLLVVGGLLTACAIPVGGGDSSASPDPDAPVGTAPGSLGPEPSGDGAMRDTPDPSITNPHPTAVDHFAIGPDGRTLVVYYWGGSEICFGLQRVEVGTDADGTPVITVYEGNRPEAEGQACDMMARLKSAVVTLESPVVIDASQPDAPPGEPDLAPEPQVVTVQVGIQDPHAVAITGYTLSGDGLTLTAQFYGGVPECYGLATATLDASSRPALVEISEGRVPGSEVFIEIALAKAFAFTLETPLIRDGSL